MKVKALLPETIDLHFHFKFPPLGLPDHSVLFLHLTDIVLLHLSHHVDHHAILLLDHSLQFLCHHS